MQNQHDTIIFFQGNDLVIPAEMPEEKIISVCLEDTRSNIEWQKDLLTFAQSFAPATPTAIPMLIETQKINAVLLHDTVVLSEKWKRVPIRSILSFAKRSEKNFPWQIQNIFRAYHLLQWKNNTQFCGRCGGKNNDSAKDISRICESCGNMIFPKISPAIIVLITNDKNQILLAHNKNFKNSMYSLLAGFVEAGESLEQTVAREVKEEVNIDVDCIHYCHSQPWPFPDSIMLGFRAKHKSGELKPDGVEIIDAGWFSKDNLPDIPGPGAIARYLIDQWREEA